MIFSFGHSEQERIEVDVQGYERAPSGEYWDDNWLNIEVRVRVGGFQGKATASIITSELAKFASELRPHYETLSGVAEFATLEQQLSLRLSGDGNGHIELRGEVVDGAGMKNRLHFTLQFDQSELKASIHEIDKVISLFPSRST